MLLRKLILKIKETSFLPIFTISWTGRPVYGSKRLGKASFYLVSFVRCNIYAFSQLQPGERKSHP